MAAIHSVGDKWNGPLDYNGVIVEFEIMAIEKDKYLKEDSIECIGYKARYEWPKNSNEFIYFGFYYEKKS